MALLPCPATSASNLSIWPSAKRLVRSHWISTLSPRTLSKDIEIWSKSVLLSSILNRMSLSSQLLSSLGSSAIWIQRLLTPIFSRLSRGSFHTTTKRSWTTTANSSKLDIVCSSATSLTCSTRMILHASSTLSFSCTTVSTWPARTRPSLYSRLIRSRLSHVIMTWFQDFRARIFFRNLWVSFSRVSSPFRMKSTSTLFRISLWRSPLLSTIKSWASLKL